MPPRKPRYVFALTNTLIVGPFGRARLSKGDAWHADHPVVQLHGDLFSEEPPDIHPRGWEPPAEGKVEQATKAPGEKRNTRRGND